MLVNRIVYGSWVLILLCAVAVAAFNLNAHPTPVVNTIPDSTEAAGDVDDRRVQAVGFQDDSPGRLPVVSDQDPLAETKLKELRRIVSEEMPGASDDQIQIWAEEFKDVPEQMLRFMLRQKRSHDDTAMGPIEAALLPPGEESGPMPEANTSRDAIDAARSVIVGNMMNLSTVGHRAEVVEFAANGHGLQVAETRYLMDKGDIQHTNRPFDLTIEEGFFVVAAAGHEYFTRAGRFTMNAERRLVLRIGDDEYQLQGLKPIPSDVSDIKILPNGKATAATQEGPVAIGTLQVARFLDASRLKSFGNCLFGESIASGVPQFDFKPVVQQGCLELSNGRVDQLRVELNRLTEWETLLNASGPFGSPRPASARLLKAD